MELEREKWHSSTTTVLKTGCGSMFVTIVYSFEKKDKPIKCLTYFGKAGGCAKLHMNSHSQHLSHILELKESGERLLALNELAGNTCQMGEKCCVELLVRYLIEEEMKGGNDGN